MKDNKPLCLAVIILAMLTANVYGQRTDSPKPFYNYYYDYKLANPAFVGTKSKHLINTVYSGVTGNSSPRFLYASYERNINSLQHGAGASFMYDEAGPRTRLLGGIFYSHRIKFNDERGLRLGTHAFYLRRTVDYDYYRPLDPNDPLLVSGTATTHSLSFDLGVAYDSPAITIGVSFKNLIRRDPEIRTMNVLVTRTVNITDGLRLEPSLLFYTELRNYAAASLNNILEIKQWILVGGGYTISADGYDDLTFSAGLNIKDWVQLIAHVYSKENQKYNIGSADRVIETMIRVTIPQKD
jgi:type IX secretion system PorP/SprF family membrane protein